MRGSGLHFLTGALADWRAEWTSYVPPNVTRARCTCPSRPANVTDASALEYRSADLWRLIDVSLVHNVRPDGREQLFLHRSCTCTPIASAIDVLNEVASTEDSHLVGYRGAFKVLGGPSTLEVVDWSWMQEFWAIATPKHWPGSPPWVFGELPLAEAARRRSEHLPLAYAGLPGWRNTRNVVRRAVETL